MPSPCSDDPVLFWSCVGVVVEGGSMSHAEDARGEAKNSFSFFFSFSFVFFSFSSIFFPINKEVGGSSSEVM